MSDKKKRTPEEQAAIDAWAKAQTEFVCQVLGGVRKAKQEIHQITNPSER